MGLQATLLPIRYSIKFLDQKHHIFELHSTAYNFVWLPILFHILIKNPFSFYSKTIKNGTQKSKITWIFTQILIKNPSWISSLFTIWPISLHCFQTHHFWTCKNTLKIGLKFLIKKHAIWQNCGSKIPVWNIRQNIGKCQ